MPKGFTATTISLIPKTASPTCWSEYRPISLCNVTNKICTKLMTIRLGHVLPKVISLSQSGFVPGRLLSDNVLLAQELIHSIESHQPDANVVFKLDMAKAYDRAPGMIRVSHLAYADDLMIFTTTCRQNMELLRDFLRAYERVSGQLINGLKSFFIVGRQASSLQTQAVQDVLGYQLKHLPITYLGVPLYKGNKKACLFDPIISRLRDLLQGWAMTNLSHGGRLALIRSVLQATPLHLLQVIHPLKSVLITIERIFNSFFWGSYNGRKHIHWSSWAKACFPMAEGGLGVRSLADYVRAFSMKLGWRFRGKSSLWSEYLHGRYCRNLHPTIVPYNRNHSSIWHRLCRIRDVAEPFIFWTLGEGSVSFWHDNWFGEKPLAQLVHRDTYTMESVRYYWHEAGQGDRNVWTESSTGDFSTKSAWEAIRQASPRRQLLADVWHRSLRPTISVFLWRLFQDRIPVDARMQQKGFSFPSKCQCCEAEETVSHLFIESAAVQGVWQHFAAIFGLCLCDTGSLTHMVHFWRYSTPFHSDLHIRTLIPFLILWFTWTQRNAAKYRVISFSTDSIILEVQRHLRTLSSSPSIVRWHAPSPSWFKLNTDGSSLGNLGLAGAVGIIRDSAGHVHLAYQFALGTGTSVLAELTAVWRGMELALTHGLAPLVVEVDATTVISLLQSRASGKEANGAADHLAKEAASLQLTRLLHHDDITGILRGILCLDRQGVPHLRRG
ncbi:UNVERIFIED_CONTAM: putative ribonuclease H protein [Sesamum calycinum]|uniref:Ribonuclease H protein n=1 Tax=Sesamum calycinum TaxID=2727403 RepID=A0AAW2KCM6_9LAMI